MLIWRVVLTPSVLDCRRPGAHRDPRCGSPAEPRPPKGNGAGPWVAFRGFERSRVYVWVRVGRWPSPHVHWYGLYKVGDQCNGNETPRRFLNNIKMRESRCHVTLFVRRVKILRSLSLDVSPHKGIDYGSVVYKGVYGRLCFSHKFVALGTMHAR